MSADPQRRTRLPQPASLATALALAVVAVLALSLGAPGTAHALPEYATRTGESCATCHVSAGGGGPRTLRGLLWAARGRPDKVPSLPNTLAAPGVQSGEELYSISCAGCHGPKGEGLFAVRLTGARVGAGANRSFIRFGIAKFGMPAFEGQFTPEQLDTLVAYVTGLGNGAIAPPQDAYPLGPAVLRCQPANAACGQPLHRSKGN